MTFCGMLVPPQATRRRSLLTELDAATVRDSSAVGVGAVSVQERCKIESTRAEVAGRLSGIVQPSLKSGNNDHGLAAAGFDPAALDFEEIVRTHRARIFRYAFAWLRDSDAADTVTQDCFMKAFRNWRGFRRECSLDTWLMQIAVNLVRDQARNRRLRFWRRTQAQSEPAEMADNRIAAAAKTPEAQMLLEERVQAVWRAAGELAERQRTVFLLRFVEEMEVLEIAEITGMKEGTVKAHLFSAIRNVRKHMGAGA